MMKQRWKWAWEGRVFQGLEILQKSHQGKTINAIAIKGGPQCDWELAQLMPGGNVRKIFPGIRLVVFDQLDEFVEAMANGAWETLGNQANGT